MRHRSHPFVEVDDGPAKGVPEDIACGAEVLYRTLLRLDKT
mgnify:CR=1 FL=1